MDRNTTTRQSTRERIVELFDNANMTVPTADKKGSLTFNELLNLYEVETGIQGTTLERAVSAMLFENRKPTDYYSLSPAEFDAEGNSQSKDGYNTRMSLCDSTAWEIINNPEIMTMKNVEDFMQKKSEELKKEYYEQHNLQEKSMDSNRNILTSIPVTEQDFLQFRDTVLKDSIKEKSVPFQTVDFSRNNFNKLFPWSRIETPVESVKFGEGQFTKFSFKERRNLLAAVYETLVTPDIVIEEERFNEFNEPATSHNYAKDFMMDSDSKMIQSVVVEIEDKNIIITSHERPVNEILNKIKKADQILFIAPEIGLSVRQKVQNGQSMADQNLSETLQGKTSFLNKAYNYNETKSINYMLSENLLTNNEVLRYGQPIGKAAVERINKVLSDDEKKELEPLTHQNDTLEEAMRCIGDSYDLPEEATKKRRKAAIHTLNRAHLVFEKYSEYIERKNKEKKQEQIMDRNTRKLSDRDIEKAWESLENEPFATNSNGEQVLDSENGWFGFDRGTTQQEIWRWFDTHYSKGVAYLVNDYVQEENMEIGSKNQSKTLTWDEIQDAAAGAHWNDEELAVKNKAKEQTVKYAKEIGAELNADDEDDIASFTKDYEIDFQQDGTMNENRHLLESAKPEFGHEDAVLSMLSKYLEEETEKDAENNNGKEFASNFSRDRFATGDIRTMIQYANHLDNGSGQWMLGARAGGERQLYYRDPINFKDGEWQKATAQEFFDFIGDFYARNYDRESEFDVDNLPMMRQLFPNSKDIEKLWRQNFTKDDMQQEDVRDLWDHSSHGEIWSHVPDVDDGTGNPIVTLEDAVEAAVSYLEVYEELKDKDFGNRSDSTEDEKNTRKEFLSLLKNVNDALHSDDFFDSPYDFENATAENLDLLHAEVLKDCAGIAREAFLDSFGEIIDGEYPNQEEAEYRRHTLNELNIDSENLDNYLDSNASRLIENAYEKAKSIRGVDMFDFVEAAVDTSDPTDEHEMQWNRALEELLDGYTDYKDFNEKWDVGLTRATAIEAYLESEKELMHVAFENALGNDRVEVPAKAYKYKDFLDSIDFDRRYSHSNLLNSETLQMGKEKLQEQNAQKDNNIERISAIFNGMEAPDLFGKPKDIKGLIENYENSGKVKLPIAEAVSTMLYDSPQIHEAGSYKNFYALSKENFDDKYGQNGTDARNELCDMVAVKIVSDKSVKNMEQVKELLKNDSEKIFKEKLEELTHSAEFIAKFGDWEKENRIEKLKNSESLQISSKIIIRGKDETSYINELRNNPSKESLRKLTNIIFDFGKEMLQNLRFEQNLDSYASPLLTVNDDGKKYHLNFSGIKETSNHNLYQKGHIEGIYNIPQIIESAIYLTTEKNEDNRKPELKQFHYYSLGVKIDNDDYTAKIVFTENKNGEIYYDQSLSTMEKGKLIDLIQTKNKPIAVNPINRRDSNELSENKTPSAYYDKRLFNICQVPQMPYLEMKNGKWRPTQKAIKAVGNNKLFIEKNGQKYVMHDEILLEKKNMENEELFKISEPDMKRLSQLFNGMTVLDADSNSVDFKGLVENYKNNKQPGDVLKDAVASMIHENREPEDYYSLSASVYDAESEAKDKEGYDMRWDLCENAAEKIIKDKSITTMKQVENYLSDEAVRLSEQFNHEHKKEIDKDSPELATWEQLKKLVDTRDFDSVKDDALEGNPGFDEKEWKEETLARCLEDGILDLRGFSTSSDSKINDLQFDPEFTKSDKWNLYEKIEPEKWRIIEELSKEIVGDRETLDNGDIGLGDIQSKYDDLLSESPVYHEAVEKELVPIDDIMADTIDQNENIDMDSLSDTIKEKMVLAMPSSPTWSKIERFVVTPEKLKGDYSAKELAQFLNSYRDKKEEPSVTEKQAKVIMRYLRENDYAAAVDQKGNLKVVDFSEEFNLVDEPEIMTSKSLVEFTEDLISKDEGFEDRAEDDLKTMQPLQNFYEKGKASQPEISPENQLLQSFSDKMNMTLLANNLSPDRKTIGSAFKFVFENYGAEDRQKIKSIMSRNGCKDAEKTDLFMKNLQERNFGSIKLDSPARKKEAEKEYGRER